MLFRGLIAGQMSGSTAGLVASHNRGGSYFRARSVPVNPNTVAQQDQRTAFGAAAIGWSSLSEAQRGGWRSYAAATPVVNRIGDSTLLTGFNWYVAVNAFSIRIGVSVFDDAPIDPGLSDLGAVTSVTASVLSGVSLVTSGATADVAVLIGYSPIRSAGARRLSGPYSRFGQQAMTATGFSGSPQNPVVGRYGSIQAGEIRVFRFAAIDSVGRLSNVVERIVTVVA